MSKHTRALKQAERDYSKATSKLEQLQTEHDRMQKSLDDSDEGLVVSKITKIYDSTLQREPDTIGLNHWKQKILNNEISFEQLEKMIKNSPEAMMINEN